MGGDDRIRLFCGLQPSADALDWLAAWQADELAGGGRVVPRENLHVTLAFLGHRPVEEVPAIARELWEASAAAGAIDLRVRRYRETRSAGMLVLDDAGGAATALAEDLQERLERLGVFRREARPWLPHVTVLRCKEPAGLRREVANTCSIHVVRSAVYRSSLGVGAAHYEVLETAVLGGR